MRDPQQQSDVGGLVRVPSSSPPFCLDYLLSSWLPLLYTVHFTLLPALYVLICASTALVSRTILYVLFRRCEIGAFRQRQPAL